MKKTISILLFLAICSGVKTLGFDLPKISIYGEHSMVIETKLGRIFRFKDQVIYFSVSNQHTSDLNGTSIVLYTFDTSPESYKRLKQKIDEIHTQTKANVFKEGNGYDKNGIMFYTSPHMYMGLLFFTDIQANDIDNIWLYPQ